MSVRLVVLWLLIVLLIVLLLILGFPSFTARKDNRAYAPVNDADTDTDSEHPLASV